MITTITRLTSSKTPEVFQLCFQVFAIATIATHKIQQIKLVTQFDLTSFGFLNARRFGASLSNIVVALLPPVIIGESVDVKRNLHLLTEPCKVEQLLDSICRMPPSNQTSQG